MAEEKEKILPIQEIIFQNIKIKHFQVYLHF